MSSSRSRPRIAELRETWRRILHVGIPAVATHLLPSALRGVITALAAGVGGATAVAALAAGSRVESIPMMVGWAYNSALLAVIGQNWGARRFDRVRRARREYVGMSFLYGLPLFGLMVALAPAAARSFTSDRLVLEPSCLVRSRHSSGCNPSRWSGLLHHC